MEAAPNQEVELLPGPNPEIDETDWRAVMDSTREASRHHIALDYLSRAAQDILTSPERLAERVRLAGEYGATTEQIIATLRGDA